MSGTRLHLVTSHVFQRYGIANLLVSLLLFAGVSDGGSAQDTTTDTETEQSHVQSEDAGKEEDVVPSEKEQRELGAGEDPLQLDKAKREVERQEEKKDLGKKPSRTTGFDVYGSIRVRYRDQADETGFQDGGSRMGGDVDWQYREGSYLFGRYEIGFNVLTGVQDLNPGKDSSEEFEDSVFTRLRYVGLDSPAVTAVVGKNWSTYYKVADFTDRFQGTGGSASGAYNAQTDGGPTGPGRADQTIQSKFRIDFLPQRTFKPFDLNVQVQKGNPIPFSNGAEYGTAFGISAIMTTHNEFTVGLAYNQANIDLTNNPSLRDIGISGDARAAILGARAFGERWYAGLVVARLENHDTTDDGIYFDGWGSEFYGQYHLFDRLWLIGGYNVLEPDSDEVQARSYRVRYGILGLRYTFDDFRRMIFANVQIDDGVAADGTPVSNIYTIGVRWDLSKRGWHIGQQ